MNKLRPALTAADWCRLNQLLGDKGKVSVNDLIIKAVALALRRVPECNAQWEGDAIRQFHRVHIGVAVALDEGLIWGAGLDVTDPEPLPKDHRLWTHPRVIVTPHTAGGSPRRAQRVIDTFCENLRRLRSGQPLVALIDKDKGY